MSSRSCTPTMCAGRRWRWQTTMPQCPRPGATACRQHPSPLCTGKQITLSVQCFLEGCIRRVFEVTARPAY